MIFQRYQPPYVKGPSHFLLFHKIFWTKLLTRKTNLVLTTKCYMSKYDQDMNQTLLYYEQVEKNCQNFR